MHGGLVAGALDEAVGLLATWYAFPAVTVRIFVRYRHPVPINTELLLRASLDDARGRRLHVNATTRRRGRGVRRVQGRAAARPARALPAHARGPRGGGALGSGAGEHLVDAPQAGRQERRGTRAVERHVRRPVGRRVGGFEPRRVGAEQHCEIEPGDGVGAGDVQRPGADCSEQLEERVCEIADLDGRPDLVDVETPVLLGAAAPAGRGPSRRRSATS